MEYFDYYWAGADVKWKDNQIESITLADGRKMEDEETYTVTFPIQDYTEDVGEMGNPKPLTYTSKDLLREYLKTNSPVQPPEVLR